MKFPALFFIIILLSNCTSSAPDSSHSVLEDDLAQNKPIDIDQDVIDWESLFTKKGAQDINSYIADKKRTYEAHESPESLLHLARAELSVGRFKYAEAYFRQLVGEKQYIAESYMGLAQLYLQSNQIDKSLEYLRYMKSELDDYESPPKTLMIFHDYIHAHALLRLGKMNKAYDLLAGVIAMNRRFIPAYALLASSYIQNNGLETARFIAKRGLDTAGHHEMLWNILAVIAYQEGRYVKAREYIDRALKKNKSHAPSLTTRAKIALYYGHIESAELDLIAASKVDPLHVQSHILLGNLKLRQGQDNSAKSFYDKALHYDPQNRFARYNLAILKMRSPEGGAQALRLFHEVLQLSQGQDDRLSQLAQLNIEKITHSQQSVEILQPLF